MKKSEKQNWLNWRLFCTAALVLVVFFAGCDNSPDEPSGPTAAQKAADFIAAHADILAKTTENIAIADEDGVAAALAAYNALGTDVQSLLANEKGKLDNLTEAIETLKGVAAGLAEVFRTKHEDVLAKDLEDITLDDEDAYVSAITEYNSLSPEVQSLLTAEKTKLDAIFGKLDGQKPLPSPTATVNPVKSDYTLGETITVTLECPGNPGVTIWYTLDGRSPVSSPDREEFSGSIEITMNRPYTIRAIAMDPSEVKANSAISIIRYGITGYTAPVWNVVSAGTASDQTGFAASTTIWSIAYGNGTFIAVGAGNTDPATGQFSRSDDGGETWINTPAGGNANSTDVNQTTIAAGTAVRDIAYGNGTFMVVTGANGRIVYSKTNGASWSSVAAANVKATVNIRGICYGGHSGEEKFIAVGMNGTYNGTSGTYNLSYSTSTTTSTSADYATWTGIDTRTVFDGSSGGIQGICYGGPEGKEKFVAVGTSGKMAYSEDGTDWTAISTDIFTGLTVYSITYGDGVFVAGGSNGADAGGAGFEAKLAYSTDGINWQEANTSYLPNPNTDIRKIVWGDGKFIGVGGSSSSPTGRIITSIDGIAWMDLAVGDVLPNPPFVRGVAYGDGIFVITLHNGNIIYSDPQE